MSKTKIIEGEEYILKSQVDEIVRSRIAKYSEKSREAEMKIDALQTELDESRSKLAVSDKLTAQIDALQSELNQTRTQYERHSVISEFGITDPSVRDAVEIFHEREMKTRPKKDQQSLSDWLTSIKTDPSTAPTILKPHFTQNSSPAGEQNTSTTVEGAITTPPTTPPTSNSGVQNGGQNMSSDVLSKAHDPAFFESNRELIREAWYKQRNKPTAFK